ncbi:MAG: hypothetical protein KatS3mg106_086 [Gemmataceae bacterium]|nr:MAG: hypothetical protein KatS3mg106_086 [Gemmataceae bacterium]
MITALVILLLLLAGDLFFCFVLLLFVWYHQRRDSQAQPEEADAATQPDPSLGCLMAFSLAGAALLLLLAWLLWPSVHM